MTPASTEAQQSRGPRIVLIAAAALELVSGIRDFPNTARIAPHPVIAGLALILAVRSRLRGVLAAFAALLVMT